MRTLTPIAGPYVHAMGWTWRPSHSPVVGVSTRWGSLTPPIVFESSGEYSAPYGEVPDMLAPLPLPLMRCSGVARPRSAAKSTVFAALLGRALLDAVREAPGFDRNAVGIALASSSAITRIAWDFETTGVRSGWERADAMLLPSSIPSAIATQTSAALDIHGGAISFQDGALGVSAAFEHAFLSLAHARTEHFLVIGAEEACEVQHRAIARLGVKRSIVDGASGFVLSRRRIAESDWRLRLVGHTSEDRPPPMAGEWAGAPITHVSCGSRLGAYTSTLLAFAVHHAFTSGARRAVVACLLPTRGCFILGFTVDD